MVALLSVLFIVLVVIVGVVLVLTGKASSTVLRVSRRDRAAGVHPSLLALLNDWEANGSHAVVVAPNGGLRTSSALQAALAAGGSSNATTLQLTPHGRGAALDVWPTSFLAHVPVTEGGLAARWSSWEQIPADVKAEFAAFGAFAEARGFKWGGRWRSATFPNGDQPHVEIPNWGSMPFPIPGGAYV